MHDGTDGPSGKGPTTSQILKRKRTSCGTRKIIQTGSIIGKYAGKDFENYCSRKDGVCAEHTLPSRLLVAKQFSAGALKMIKTSFLSGSA
jgi:hypothetical protein